MYGPYTFSLYIIFQVIAFIHIFHMITFQMTLGQVVEFFVCGIMGSFGYDTMETIL